VSAGPQNPGETPATAGAATSDPAVSDPAVAGPAVSEAPAESTPDEKSHSPWWRETLILVVTALALALIIKTFFVQAFYIPSGSMENTLKVNDRILVEKVSYWFGSPQRGDIIVFKDPDDWLGEEGGAEPSNPLTKGLAFIGLYPEGGHLVKRVIGVGGDHVRCHDGKVSVNGVNLEESDYVTLSAEACLGAWSVVVPPDHLWVLGDNRDNSADSRAHMGDPGGGFIPENDVVGKVFVTVWPISHWRFFRTPETFKNPALDAAVGVVGETAPIAAGTVVLLPLLYRRRWLRLPKDGYGETDLAGPGSDEDVPEPAWSAGDR